MVAAVFTLAVVALPSVRFGYRSPALHVALETANALVALLVGYLVYGRFRESRRIQELLLVLALCTVAVANLILTAVPFALAIGRGEDFSRWAAVGIRLLGTLVLTAAALVPPAATVDTQRAKRVVLTLAVAVGTVAVAGLVWGNELPPTVDPSVTLGDGSRPMVVAHPAVLVIQGVGALQWHDEPRRGHAQPRRRSAPRRLRRTLLR